MSVPRHTPAQLAADYGSKVYNIAFRLTGNREDAEDVTQNTFLQIQKKLGTFKGESAVFTWIYRIAVNNSLMVKRKLDRERMEALDEQIAIFSHDIPEEVKRLQNNPEERYAYDELLRFIRQECYYFMTFRLSDPQRVVYILRVVLGFSLDEVAGILDIAKNTVKVRLQRAKDNLRAHFSERCQWIPGGEGCSCESRIGFICALMQDVLVKLRSIQPDADIKKTVRETLQAVTDIDIIYRHLPQEKPRRQVLDAFLSR